MFGLVAGPLEPGEVEVIDDRVVVGAEPHFPAWPSVGFVGQGGDYHFAVTGLAAQRAQQCQDRGGGLVTEIGVKIRVGFELGTTGHNEPPVGGIAEAAEVGDDLPGLAARRGRFHRRPVAFIVEPPPTDQGLKVFEAGRGMGSDEVRAT